MTNIFSTKFIRTYLFCAIVLLLAMLFLYIFQVGILAQQEYLIWDCEQKLAILLEDNTFLGIGLSQKNSLSNIENYLVDKSFVKASQVRYIQILPGTVVSK